MKTDEEILFRKIRETIKIDINTHEFEKFMNELVALTRQDCEKKFSEEMAPLLLGELNTGFKEGQKAIVLARQDCEKERKSIPEDLFLNNFEQRIKKAERERILEIINKEINKTDGNIDFDLNNLEKRIKKEVLKK